MKRPRCERRRPTPPRLPRSRQSTPRPLLAGLGRLRLIDARAGERFRGEVEPLDKVAGHIPGALNRPFKDNLTADGRFKSAAALRAEWLPLLAGADTAQVVHQCGSGVTACHNLLAQEHAGLGDACSTRVRGASGRPTRRGRKRRAESPLT